MYPSHLKLLVYNCVQNFVLPSLKMKPCLWALNWDRTISSQVSINFPLQFLCWPFFFLFYEQIYTIRFFPPSFLSKSRLVHLQLQLQLVRFEPGNSSFTQAGTWNTLTLFFVIFFFLYIETICTYIRWLKFSNHYKIGARLCRQWRKRSSKTALMLTIRSAMRFPQLRIQV